MRPRRRRFPPPPRGRQAAGSIRAVRADPARGEAPPRFLITAGEAFPAFEERVLAARRHIRMGFRLFDPLTPLRSEAARAVGHDWFDLMVHTLRRGVRVDLALCDFDPVVASGLHRGTWRSLRILLAAAEVAGPGARLHAVAALHPARVARLPRMMLYGRIRGELRTRAEWLNGMDDGRRRRALDEMPGLVRYLVPRGDGHAPAPFTLAGLAPTTHHQKLAVFDEEWLLIGGLDLNERRWDTPEHDRPGRETWADVMTLVQGQAARDAHAHLGRFLDEVAGRAPPAPDAGLLLRTLSKKRRTPHLKLSPEPLVDELAQLHYRAVGEAERFVYLESQFLRDRRLANVLAGAAERNPRLTCILILPAAPEDVAFDGNRDLDARFGEYLQAHCVRKIRRAFGRRLFVGCPARPTLQLSGDRDVHARAPIVYVHSKVSVFDDRLACVSSANLNGRSFRWDTEAGVAFDDPSDVRRLRRRLFEHWLPKDAEAHCFSPETAARSWAAIAEENMRRHPARRRGFLLPYSTRHAERLGQGLPGVPEEMV